MPSASAIKARFGRAAVSVGMLSVATLVAAVLTFLLQVTLARRLSPAEYGAFAAALATITLVAPLAGMGLGPFWLFAFGNEGWSGHRWLRPSFRVFGITLAVASICVFAWAMRGGETLTRAITLTLIPLVGSQGLLPLIHARYQLEHRYGFVALWQLVSPSARLLVALLASTAIGVAVGFSVAAVVILAMGFWILRDASVSGMNLAGHGKRDDSTEREITSPRKRDTFRSALPYGVSGFLHFIYLQSDIVLLGLLVGPVVAGNYNVAFTVLMALYLLPSILYQKFLLPKLHRWSAHDSDAFVKVLRVGAGAMLVLGLLAMGILLVLVQPLVPAVFGPDQAAAVPLLQVLALAIPIRYVSMSLGATLTTGNHVKRKVRMQAITAVVNVLLNLALIPSFHALGAAYATITTEALLLAVYGFTVKKQVLAPILKMERNEAPRTS